MTKRRATFVMSSALILNTCPVNLNLCILISLVIVRWIRESLQLIFAQNRLKVNMSHMVRIRIAEK